MDEIGRGTSTYDGISIAWAVAEYLVKNIKPAPKTLFATHYHELQALEDQYPKQIKNFHMAVADDRGEPVFLHTILPGGASHSFGVAVAKLAGVPQEVIDRAYEILQTLEFRDVTEKGKQYFNSSDSQFISPSLLMGEGRGEGVASIADHLILKEFQQLDLSNMTPLEALNKLAEIKDKLKLLQIQTKEFFESD
jgi:DNA mismatch repair protein MutS